MTTTHSTQTEKKEIPRIPSKDDVALALAMWAAKKPGMSSVLVQAPFLGVVMVDADDKIIGIGAGGCDKNQIRTCVDNNLIDLIHPARKLVVENASRAKGAKIFVSGKLKCPACLKILSQIGVKEIIYLLADHKENSMEFPSPNPHEDQEKYEIESAITNILLRSNCRYSAHKIDNTTRVVLDDVDAMIDQLEEFTDHAWYMGFALIVRHKSDDGDRKVGCVLRKGDTIVGIGYNGFQQKAHDADYSNAKTGEAAKKYYVIHAEQNLFLFRSVQDAKRSTLYSTRLPCNECGPLVCQLGVKCAHIGYIPDKPREYEDSYKMMKAKGVEIITYKYRDVHESGEKIPSWVKEYEEQTSSSASKRQRKA